MEKYNEHNIYIVSTQEAMSWDGKRVIVKTNEGIMVEGVVSGCVLPGPTHNPPEWLGIKIDGSITLSLGVINELVVLYE